MKWLLGDVPLYLLNVQDVSRAECAWFSDLKCFETTLMHHVLAGSLMCILGCCCSLQVNDLFLKVSDLTSAVNGIVWESWLPNRVCACRIGS